MFSSHRSKELNKGSTSWGLAGRTRAILPPPDLDVGGANEGLDPCSHDKRCDNFFLKLFTATTATRIPRAAAVPRRIFLLLFIANFSRKCSIRSTAHLPTLRSARRQGKAREQIPPNSSVSVSRLSRQPRERTFQSSRIARGTRAGAATPSSRPPRQILSPGSQPSMGFLGARTCPANEICRLSFCFFLTPEQVWYQ